MIGRFFYHAFWNFYDYLGTLTLIGALHTLLALGLMAATAGLTDLSTSGGKVIAGVMILLQVVLVAYALAGLLPYCAKAARNEPARWPDLKLALKNFPVRVGLIFGIWIFILVILVVNFLFYLRLNSQMESGGVQLALVIVSASVAWITVAWMFFGCPWLCAATASTEQPSLKQTLSKGLMVIALLPATWIVVFISLTMAFAAGLYTRLGLIFFLPLFASVGQTAFALSVQYAGFLTIAREELGEQMPLRQYKRRARELAWEWEHRQPRRNFKELIRPWDY